MKRAMIAMIVMIFIVGLAGCTTLGLKKGESTAKLIVETPKVELSKKAKVSLRGEGFKAGQEVAILFRDDDGVLSDIGYTLKPEPVADKTGAWATTWSCGRFISKKIIKEGPYLLKATDSDYTVIAEVTVTFFAKK